MRGFLEIQEWIKQLWAANNRPYSQLIIEPFGYPLTFSGLAAVGGNTTLGFSVNANADFVLMRVNYHANTGAVQNVGNKTVAQIRVQCVDAGSARPFWNSAIDIENFASNEYPDRFLPYPRVISANSAISVQLTGTGAAAETYAGEIFFEGVSVREFG
jgi:hypothetical protein